MNELCTNKCVMIIMSVVKIPDLDYKLYSGYPNLTEWQVKIIKKCNSIYIR